MPAVTEAACLGAALLGGVAAGLYPDFVSAAEQVVQLAHRVEPQADSATAYNERFQLYEQVYPTVSALQRRL